MNLRKNLDCNKSEKKNYFERKFRIPFNQILAAAATSWVLQHHFGSCSHILAPVSTYGHLELHIKVLLAPATGSRSTLLAYGAAPKTT